ncbi:hydantoinase B/oxoprolinase family protein [Bacillus licheniformis]|nr:hydantoinase B/oxoprolinase family protein [Bacillus licheniformis]
MRANSRVPDLNEGDIHAMVAAVNTAENRLTEMVGKFGKKRSNKEWMICSNKPR